MPGEAHAARGRGRSWRAEAPWLHQCDFSSYAVILSAWRWADHDSLVAGAHLRVALPLKLDVLGRSFTRIKVGMSQNPSGFSALHAYLLALRNRP